MASQLEDQSHENSCEMLVSARSRWGFAVSDDETQPDDDTISDTASVDQIVPTRPVEFGRTYHAYHAGSYAFPNDDLEQERLLLQSECITCLFGGRLYFAPLLASDPPRRILDLATGVGDWAVAMSDLFPKSTVLGTDLSPIHSTLGRSNVHFSVEDSTNTWDFPHKFDYIHTRSTAGCWESFENQVAEQAFDALEPGGWFESQELDGGVCCDDGTLDRDGPVARWFNDQVAASAKIGRPAVLGATLKEVYERVGFIDVQQRMVKMPIGGWPSDRRLKELGLMWRENLADGLWGFSYQLLNRAFGRTATDIEESLIEVLRHIGDEQVHAYMPGFVVWGRKPFVNKTGR